MNITEVSEAAITVRGTFFPPGINKSVFLLVNIGSAMLFLLRQLVAFCLRDLTLAATIDPRDPRTFVQFLTTTGWRKPKNAEKERLKIVCCEKTCPPLICMLLRDLFR